MSNRVIAFFTAMLAMFSPAVFAVSSDANSTVTQAFTEGGTSVGLVVVGVIGLAATMTGLGLIYAWLRK